MAFLPYIKTLWFTQRRLFVGIALLVVGLVTLYTLQQYRGHSSSAGESDSQPLPDTLRVATLSGSTLYFQYRGEDMGYQYELLQAYSQWVGRPFVLQVAPSLDSIHRLLAEGRIDLSITPEAVTTQGKEHLRYTGPEQESHMVLVQRKPHSKQDSSYVRDVTALLGRSISVRSGSHHIQRLRHLEEQLGGRFDIVEVSSDTIDTEDLIAEVAGGGIDLTIINSDLAALAQIYYRGLDFSLSLSFPQKMRWTTSLHREALARSLDQWALEAPAVSKGIYRRYFEMNEVAEAASSRRIAIPERQPDGSISPYDELFKQAAQQASWSWQLLPAIAYQESNFIADIVGRSGARGLMGIMPRTGAAYGASKEDLLKAEVSVRVSVRCLRDMEQYFRSVPNAEQRLKLTLAAYNAGPAHVQDAQRLAEKYGHDPQVWDNHVERYMILKSDPKYYNDPVCRYGYLRGRETCNYVREVIHRYESYRH